MCILCVLQLPQLQNMIHNIKNKKIKKPYSSEIVIGISIGESLKNIQNGRCAKFSFERQKFPAQ